MEGVRGREDGGGPRRVPQELLLLQALRQGRRLLQLRQPQGTECITLVMHWLVREVFESKNNLRKIRTVFSRLL